MNIIYLDDYKHDEEAALAASGLLCFRYNHRDLMKGSFPENNCDNQYLIRGPRLPLDAYKRIFEAAGAKGLHITPDWRSYVLGADQTEQYKVLQEFYPKAVVAEASISSENLLNLLKNEKIRFPVFLRSEIESAAKYVGVSGCMIVTPSIADLTNALVNLKRNVHGYSTLVFKETVQIQKNQDGDTLEFRAIGWNGKIQMFDNLEYSAIPPQEVVHLVNKVIEKLLANGGAGGYFIDVAMDEASHPILIECKSLLNGSIKSISRFAPLLSNKSLSA